MAKKVRKSSIANMTARIKKQVASFDSIVRKLIKENPDIDENELVKRAFADYKQCIVANNLNGTSVMGVIYAEGAIGAVLRQLPSSTSQIVATLPNNTEVNLLDYDDGWYLATYNGKKGYVAGAYVLATGQLDGIKDFAKNLVQKAKNTVQKVKNVVKPVAQQASSAATQAAAATTANVVAQKANEVAQTAAAIAQQQQLNQQQINQVQQTSTTMNEQTKKVLKIGAIAVGVVAVGAVGYRFFKRKSTKALSGVKRKSKKKSSAKVIGYQV